MVAFKGQLCVEGKGEEEEEEDEEEDVVDHERGRKAGQGSGGWGECLSTG